MYTSAHLWSPKSPHPPSHPSPSHQRHSLQYAHQRTRGHTNKWRSRVCDTGWENETRLYVPVKWIMSARESKQRRNWNSLKTIHKLNHINLILAAEHKYTMYIELSLSTVHKCKTWLISYSQIAWDVNSVCVLLADCWQHHICTLKPNIHNMIWLCTVYKLQRVHYKITRSYITYGVSYGIELHVPSIQYDTTKLYVTKSQRV